MSASIGDTVRFHYTIKLDDGSTVNSTFGKKPIDAELGKIALLPAFENALIGMSVGESKSVKAVASDAFGSRDTNLITTVERSSLPSGTNYSPGKQFTSTDENGQTIMHTVVKEEGEMVTIDSNHPLVDQDLIINLELMEIL